MKPRRIALGVALAMSAGLVVFGDRSPDIEVAEPVERAAALPAQAAPAQAGTAAGEPTSGPISGAGTESAAGPTSGPTAGSAAEPAIARLIPRETLIGDDADRFGAGDKALFARQDWTPPAPPPPKPPPPPPPSAPPLPFTVIGKSLEDGKWEVYLSAGERTHIANEGATLDGGWRVERIAPPIMTLTYLPLNEVRQLNIGVFE
ncbi:MAG: hypothetical protein V7631_88 [Massilia sp.]|jgi:hypothetical protein